jgi:tetratricopeptide (TPR) repeat protein
VELFGPPFINLVIYDEDSNPLGSSTNGDKVIVDSIGASELHLTYLSYNLTFSNGAIWSVNVTSPVETTIILPKGAAFFDMSSIPTNIGTVGDKQYFQFEPGEISVYYILGLPRLDEEADNAIMKAETYISAKEADGYMLTGARDLLSQAQDLFDRGQYLEAKNNADDVLGIAVSIIEIADAASMEIEKAQKAVMDAEVEGRMYGLSESKLDLNKSTEYFNDGKYRQAVTAAQNAYELAISAKEPNEFSMLYVSIVVIAVISAIGIYLKVR